MTSSRTHWENTIPVLVAVMVDVTEEVNVFVFMDAVEVTVEVIVLVAVGQAYQHQLIHSCKILKTHLLQALQLW